MKMYLSKRGSTCSASFADPSSSFCGAASARSGKSKVSEAPLDSDSRAVRVPVPANASMYALRNGCSGVGLPSSAVV